MQILDSTWRGRTSMRFWIGVVLWLGCLDRAAAQETPETRSFRHAVESFQLGVFDRAEREFQQFVETFPQSTLLPESLLFQARSALRQTNVTRAIGLLSANLAKAGPLADQYRYRLGEAYLQNSNYTAAAESFLQVTRQYTNSLLLLEASHGEALARFKLGDYGQTITLLQDPAGAFQKASRTRPTDLFTLRGQLLLAEALLAVKDYRAAETAARSIPEASLTPDYRWDRQYLICRIQLADRRAPEALAQATNLVNLAVATGNRTLVADSIALQAGTLQQLNQLVPAIQVYTNNLADTVPADRRRFALLNIIEIKLAQDRVEEAEEMLESFRVRQPDDAASDVVLLTSGELRLRMHLWATATNTGAAPDTAPPSAAGTHDHLQAALALFDRLITTCTNSALLGKAQLNRGWCLWLGDKIPDSAAAFRAATQLLPVSEDLAVARFKLADAYYLKGDFTNAIRLYREVTNEFAAFPRIRDTLFPQALYQLVRAQLDAGDGDAASESIQHMLAWVPDSDLSPRGLWLIGQDRLRLRRPKEARQVFADFVQRFPDRPLRPAVELAMARTHELEDDWAEALHGYEDWISRFPTDGLLARAEFSRAYAANRALGPTNALPLFTNFVARFPTDTNAPLAQFWVAQEFFRRGKFREALIEFQIITENTNWPISRLTYEARMMAGRSAYAAQLWLDAAGDKGHFTLLLNDRSCPGPDCPSDLVAEAFFAYGDTTTQRDTDPARPLQRFVVAREAFAKIPQLFPTNRLVPLAWGRIGDCSLQLANQDPKQYENATNAFWKALSHPLADVPTRCLAECGLARALQNQTVGKAPADSVPLLKAALDHYLNVVLAKNLPEGEEPEPYWVEYAGLAAARLAEEMQQWPVAVNIYERLLKALPPLRPRLQEKLAKAQAQLRTDAEQRGTGAP